MQSKSLMRGFVERVFVMILAVALLFVFSLFTRARAAELHQRNDSVTTGTVAITSGTGIRYDLATQLSMSTGQLSEAIQSGEVILAITSLPTTGDPVVVYKFTTTTSLTATQALDDSTPTRTGVPVVEGTTVYTTLKGRYLNVDSKSANGSIRIIRVR